MKTPRLRARLLLADEVGQPLRAQRGLGGVLVALFAADEAGGVDGHGGAGLGRDCGRLHLAQLLRPSRISRAVSAPSPASRTAAAIAAAAWG